MAEAAMWRRLAFHLRQSLQNFMLSSGPLQHTHTHTTTTASGGHATPVLLRAYLLWRVCMLLVCSLFLILHIPLVPSISLRDHHYYHRHRSLVPNTYVRRSLIVVVIVMCEFRTVVSRCCAVLWMLLLCSAIAHKTFIHLYKYWMHDTTDADDDSTLVLYVRAVCILASREWWCVRFAWKYLLQNIILNRNAVGGHNRAVCPGKLLVEFMEVVRLWVGWLHTISLVLARRAAHPNRD